MFVMTPEEIRKAEVKANETILSYEKMMENAGRGCAEHIIRTNSPCETVILCGKGKNGGDGFVIAGYLHDAGFRVTVVTVFDCDSDALSMSQKEKLCDDIHILPYGKNMGTVYRLLHRADLVVDAVFGIGFSGTMREPAAGLLCAVNETQAKKIAVDVPSGLNENYKDGDICFRADETLTMLCYKPVHTYKPFSRFCGDIHVIPIGFTPDEVMPSVRRFAVCREEIRELLPPRPFDANKGIFGNALLLTGSYAMPGAAVLAATGALMTGAGLVSVAFPDAAYPAVAPQRPECVLLPLRSDANGALAAENKDILLQNLSKYTAIGIGCGLTQCEGAAECTKAILRSYTGTLILDADGINIISAHTDILNEAAGNVILTPHPGEMGRLVGMTAAAVNGNREETASAFAQKYGVTLVLKGANTVIATADGKTYINPTGNPGMSRGGSGDLLTGMITSFAAQGLSAEAAALTGVYLHGLSGDIAARTYTPYAATVQRTSECISQAISFVLS